MKYEETGKVVLNRLYVDIKNGEKVAIVGRTGAGKSSLLLALFRLVEPEEDSYYYIEGKDGLRMGLHTLRKQISSIPQSPFLFLGTIRQNLDPYRSSSDECIWAALESAEMKSTISNVNAILI